MRFYFVISSCLLLVNLALRQASAAEAYQSPGTRRMAERLRTMARTADPMNHPFLNQERADMLRAALARTSNVKQMLSLKREFATELLNAGSSEEALQQFSQLEELLKRNDPAFLAQNKPLLRTFQAMCYLRLGEQENCLINHTTDSCLLPIRAGGVHKLPRGSRGALGVLNALLNEFPNDLGARWLLNIAHMTLGEYPDKVPAQWLIPPKAFQSDYEVKRFYDVAGALGVDVNELSGGSILEDFDGDGLLDIMASSISLQHQLRYFHSNGDGTFTDKTKAAGLLGETGGLNLIQADYNNDGIPDVLVLRGAWLKQEGNQPNSLLRNNGNGTFDDVTEEAGVLSFHPTQTATWFDFNSDGWLDLFIGNESRGGETHPCELYRSNGDGTFTECAASAGVAATGIVKGVVSGDYNNDGRPDLYLSRLGLPNILFRNDGPRMADKSPKAEWKFIDVSAQAGVTEPLYSFTTWFWDYDNDGWQDIFVAGYHIVDVGDIAADYLGLPTKGEKARLYHNNHDGTFTDVSEPAKLNRILHAMGGNFGDIDNDGFLDFYVGTGNPDLSTLIPNRMYRNAGGKIFQDVTTSAGVGHLQKGHGVSFGDIDNDGDQDIYEDMGGAYSGDSYRNVLFANPGYGNRWITLKLEGVKSNRAGLGARIKVVVQTEAGERNIFKTVSPGGSFGASPLRQEIGLGKAKAIQTVEVFWPVTGRTQVIQNLAMDRCYKIREGEAQATLSALKSFKLPSATAVLDHSQHHHKK